LGAYAWVLFSQKTPLLNHFYRALQSLMKKILLVQYKYGLDIQM
jgi:hypothetical protein